MKISRHGTRTLASLVLLASCLLAGGQVRNGQNSGPNASEKGGVNGLPGQMDFQADLFSGRFSYQIPLGLAPGRHDSAPGLALVYNSANADGWCGVGWELDLGYIQRETRHGVPVQWVNGSPATAYDDNKGFVFSLNGQMSTLVNVGGTSYRAEIQGNFWQFSLQTSANQWVVTDKSGNQYTFGGTTGSRMSNPKSGWAGYSGTYRWSLSRVQTVLGDKADYTYSSIGGTLYPLNISYNGHTSGLSETHTVDFTLENRGDVRLSYLAGYRVELSQRINAVVHKVSGQVVWSNRLVYAQSSSTARSLLQSVTRYGTNLTASLPPTVLGYSVQQFGFQPAVNWTNLFLPAGSGSLYAFPANYDPTGFFADLVDMDGDGLPDRVFVPYHSAYTNFWMQHNNGTGFDNPVAYGRLSVQNYSDGVVGSLASTNANWTYLTAPYVRLIDINGDGYPDRVADPIESLSPAAGAPYSYPFTNLMVQLNNGSNFLSATDVKWTNVFFTNFVAGDAAVTDYRAVENDPPSGGLGQVMMIDLNGDGLPDRVMSRLYGSGTYKTNFVNYWVQFNTGSGFSGTNYYGFPFYDTGGTPGGYGGTLNAPFFRLIDINGDGLPDRVMYPINPTTGAPEVTMNITNYVVEFNNGYGFEPPVLWGGVIAQYLSPYAPPCTNSYYFPEYYNQNQTMQDTVECVLRDINGDGLPDRIYRYHQCVMTNWMVQINQGTNFAAPVLYGPYLSQNQLTDPAYTGIQDGIYSMLIDINGDGIPDHVMPAYSAVAATNYLVVELGKGPFPDLLTVVSNGIGGSVNVTYQPSTKLDNRETTGTANARRLLPFPVQTVSSIAVSDGLYPSNTTTYTYSGGKWNTARREFDGFATTTEVDPLGLTNIHWFHQAGGRDNSAFGEFQDSTNALAKRGIAFRVDTYGSDGNPYKLTLNKVNEWLLTGGQHFAVVTQSMTLDYPGSASAYRATAQQFNYDLNNGNLTNTTDWGEVTNVTVSGQTFTDVAGDSAYQFTVFAALANTSIVDKPQRSILTTDSAGQNILRETLYSYDGNTGNLTQRRDRMCPTCYVTNSYVYDSTYGNQISKTNEAGVPTVTVYESTYQTYPVRQTVGGTFTNTFNYDARSGKLLSSTDAKGLVTVNSYDAFLRPMETDVSSTPNGAANVWLERYDYQYGLASGFSTNFVHQHKADGVDTSNGHETWTYSDGLGRTIQTRSESETAGSYRVTDTVHDQRGNVQFTTLPYFSSGTLFTKPSGTELGMLNIFDPVGRVTNVTAAVNGSFTLGLLTTTTATGGDSGSPVAPASIAYNNGNDPWTLVVTDEATKVHRYSLDAYGRTNQIVEVNSGVSYNTYLRYNLAGDLTNITDNANNQIQYAYNNLGQLVAMADPDMGVWQYEHDFAGRMRQQIDADGRRVQFNYDDPLGRLRTRQVYDYIGNFAFGYTNVFDTSDDANFTVYAGQLYKTIDNQGWQKNGYDVRGRTVKTARYLSKNGNTYTNQYTFDDADRVTQTTYPNGGPTITNIFDTGGNLSQVKQVGGTAYYTAQGFNAIGQLNGITFGNGLATTYTYYPNSHRLQNLTTSGSRQNLTYTYDKVSNLISVTDGIYSGSASASLSSLVYDDLHRLTSLTRPTGTTSFSYDSLGNFIVNGENGAGTYNYGVRMPHAVKSANGQTNAYDACGNMMVMGNERLAYDAENRLAYVVTPTGGVLFGYDGNGARLWKSGTNGLQVWIDGNYEEKGGKKLFHVSANGQTIYTYSSDGTVAAYYHPDHLHSTAIETDNSGNLIQHYEYSAFGQSRYTQSTTAFPVTQRFTSQKLDDETGLYFYGARYYAPLLGTFIQADMVIASLTNPQHLNRYAYCVNNPLKHTDPNGKSEDNVVARVAAPAGVFLNFGNFTYQPMQVGASVNFAQASAGSAGGPALSQGNPNAIAFAPSQPANPFTYDALLTGANNLVGTQVGQQIAQGNAEAILSAPGAELALGKLALTTRTLLGSERTTLRLPASMTGELGAYEDAAQAGQIVKTKTSALPKSNARQIWENVNGQVPEGYDVDHIIQRQHGGKDELSNLQLKSSGLNRSEGPKAYQLNKSDPHGTTYDNVILDDTK